MSKGLKKPSSKNGSEKLVVVKPPELVRLDLACGQSPREGFEGVDIVATKEAKHVVDLWKFPWPWADDSVDELHASHHVEHIPAREVEERDIRPGCNGAGHEFVGQDMFFAFFDECWRILKHDGIMTVICPAARNNRAFQDPTHRRFLVQETFFYLSREFRKINKLDHYRVKCHFEGQSFGSVLQTEKDFNEEVQARRFNECWNVVHDWTVKLRALKKDVPAAEKANKFVIQGAEKEE